MSTLGTGCDWIRLTKAGVVCIAEVSTVRSSTRKECDIQLTVT